MFKVAKFFVILLAVSASLSASLSAHAAADIASLEKSKWLQVNSGNFEITTDLDPERARYLGKDMETFRYFLVKGLGVKPLSGKPLKILAIGTLSNFNSLDFPSNMQGNFAINLAGYAAVVNVNRYRPDISFGDAARHALLREYYRFLLRFSDRTENFPRWYDDGMAEYWATFRFDGKSIYIGDDGDGGVEHATNLDGGADKKTSTSSTPSDSDSNSQSSAPSRISRITVDSKELFSTPQIDFKSENSLEQEQVASFYAKSFYFIHYFNSSPQLKAALNTYISYLNYGYDADKAFSLAFKMSYEDLDYEVLKYMQRKLVMHVFSDGEKTINFPKFTPKLVELNAAGLYRNLAAILPKFSDRATTKDLLLKNLSLNPQDSEAKLAVLARGYKVNTASLIAELEKETPATPPVLIFRGDQLRKRANLLYEAGQNDWDAPMLQARALYRQAIAMDPYLPLAYQGLGDVYRYLPTTETVTEGVVGLDGASLFERSGTSNARLADLYLRMGKPLEALSALRRAVAFSSAPGESGHSGQSEYSLILDNIEMLNDLTSMKGQATATGFTFASGSVFSGKLVNGKPEGKGQITRLNGSTYTGDFAQGLMEGSGKIASFGGTTYDGQFQHGIASGKAKISYAAEQRWQIYEGQVEYSFPHGQGTAVSKIGTYVGDFERGFYHGNGRFSSAISKAVLQGRWIQDRYVWPVKEGALFVGYVNAQGLRTGEGYCVSGKPTEVRACAFLDDIESVTVRN